MREEKNDIVSMKMMHQSVDFEIDILPLELV